MGKRRGSAASGKRVGPTGREPVLAGSGRSGCNADLGLVGVMVEGCNGKRRVSARGGGRVK